MSDERPEQTGPEQGETDPAAPGRTGASSGHQSPSAPSEEAAGSGSEQQGSDQPSQEELRERLEEQIRNLRIEDLLVESAVSVLNLTARRIAKEDERDLEQARVGIEAVRAWAELLPEQAAAQIRNALSELQVLYAQMAGGSPPGEGGEGPSGEPPQQAGEPPKQGGGGRGGEPPPRIWTPRGSS